ncbi:diiron oxygenase [Streptomyces sp. NPDC048603]|uniref:diiron oxygenase n=1 Tax=Streptomyces sp. NPDC048603 TaxID=3365577 RepID=UPI00371FF9A8
MTVREMSDRPGTIEPGRPWMSEILTTPAGTPMWDELTRTQQIALTKYEAISLFSLGVHNGRASVGVAVARVHERPYAAVSELLHRFIGEENEHMRLLARFCLRHGGKLYPAPPALRADHLNRLSPAARELTAFAHVLILREIVDHHSGYMAADPSLPPVVREIHRVYHRDQSRHIAFGRMVLGNLLGQVARRDRAELPVIAEHLEAHLQHCIGTLYNPAAYRDAGIPDAPALRRRAMDHPARTEVHDQMLHRTRTFLATAGVGRDQAGAARRVRTW